MTHWKLVLYLISLIITFAGLIYSAFLGRSVETIAILAIATVFLTFHTYNEFRRGRPN